MAAEVFVAIVEHDYAVLRRFRGASSLATYLTVVSRRIVVRELLGQRTLLGVVRVHAEGEKRVVDLRRVVVGRNGRDRQLAGGCESDQQSTGEKQGLFHGEFSFERMVIFPLHAQPHSATLPLS